MAIILDTQHYFSATLQGTTQAGTFPICYGQEGAYGSSWLVQGTRPEEQEAIFLFKFIKEEGNRLWFDVRLNRDLSPRLGVGLGGEIGFHNIESTEPWKIELHGDQSAPGAFEFLLRDHRGYRVGMTSEPLPGSARPRPGFEVRRLNVEQGETVHFRANIL